MCVSNFCIRTINNVHELLTSKLPQAAHVYAMLLCKHYVDDNLCINYFKFSPTD